MKPLADALAEALTPVPSGQVLWVGVAPSVEVERASSAASLASLPTGTFAAAVIGSLSISLLESVTAVRACLGEGGVVALAVAIERDGLRGVTQRALATFDATKRPHALEDACAALLSVGVSRVKVIEVRGARGEAVIHGVLGRR